MHARKLILSVLVGGPVLGVIMGFAADPEMVALPEPSWRQAEPDPIFTESRNPDIPVFAPTYAYADRTPSWKRRTIEREIALTAVSEPEPVAVVPEPAALAIRPGTTPLDEAAEARDAAAASARPEAQPAAIEIEPEPATIG
ncbi:hypothetical protein [Novosphingobium sp. JCM 18896]|uniref:hypothetical protein n=1 Tax=Novosphingobium sp. JCM 18896 TaxID=2989731 RepID=UPI00222387FC|nr:hypothetical protein [Novosphingobium sp. JCM 18896]MCW1430345.1 hypothetical protein [Novosphingobium sp. JCM 18896]